MLARRAVCTDKHFSQRAESAHVVRLTALKFGCFVVIVFAMLMPSVVILVHSAKYRLILGIINFIILIVLIVSCKELFYFMS